MSTPMGSGYRPGRTLPFRVELVRQMRRRRTVLAFGFLLLLPWILVLAFAADGAGGSGGGGEGPGGPGVADLATAGAVNFAVFCMYVSSGFLLVVVVALFCGDTVSSEASWSSLRYLLAAPVPRTRLLRQKLLVGLALSAAAVTALPLMALAAGALVYGPHPLSLPAGGPELTAAESLSRLGVIVLYAMASLLLVAGTAFALTVATDSPLGAVGGAVALIITSNILEAVDALGAIREFLPAYWMSAWTDVLRPEIPVDGMIKGAAVSFSYAVILTAWAFRHFRTKDVLS
ncbi:ABC-2 type transport system permease protein [Spinactinospora alkalitolerans]|uniref:ABC-2 type transport system permease protein n=1 Tax=Spinactinospora alkalitolerans TaxID=687207 RepID=A0A852TUK8_9ACTN|nr:ABC transporter permease [Spinactinospora alkalitolerans]NYE45610.1 ABC-2 type transport system permease protein [Spinactinospora alkalitolerans]